MWRSNCQNVLYISVWSPTKLQGRSQNIGVDFHVNVMACSTNYAIGMSVASCDYRKKMTMCAMYFKLPSSV